MAADTGTSEPENPEEEPETHTEEMHSWTRVPTNWDDLLAASGQDPKARQAARNALTERYYDSVFRYFQRRGHQDEEAADLTHEFFTVRILPEGSWLEQVNADAPRRQGSFRAFMRKRLEWDRLDQVRSRRNNQNVPINGEGVDPADDSLSPEDAFMVDTERAQMAEAIRLARESRPDWYEVWFAHEENDRPFLEIARDLGITDNNARIRSHRFAQLILRIYRERFPGDLDGPAESESDS